MPLKRRDLVRKIRTFGGTEDRKRGKGGDRLLMRPDPEKPTRTLRSTLGYHGSNKDIVDSVVSSIRRKLKMTPEHGVSDEEWGRA